MSALPDSTYLDPATITRAYGAPAVHVPEAGGMESYTWNLDQAGSLRWFRNAQGRVTVTFSNSNGSWHRDDGPAHYAFDRSGVMREREWMRHGDYYRADGPAAESWDEDGHLQTQSWFTDRQLTARLLYTDGEVTCRQYATNGVIRREERLRDGQLHSEHGPAVSHYDARGHESSCEYWLHGKRASATYDGFVLGPAQTQRTRSALELAGGTPAPGAAAGVSTPHERPSHLAAPQQQQGRTL
ncbi:hypothetical protein [Actinomyces faecalis]|uniref:hypothetical protein n=1 Tax=Actinomyces faecalis TaxID=2722820 RepID=UPI001557DACE|nr:hypothetical protein [Actinomyces faecalis]